MSGATKPEVVTTVGAVRVERVRTNGIFSLDGEDHEVENNIWLVGDTDEVVVIDAAHEAQPILDAVNGRRVTALIMTHGHNDHINAAADVVAEAPAPILLHDDDKMLWDVVYPPSDADAPTIAAPLTEGDVIEVAGIGLEVLHTPGHSPGGCCLYAPTLGVVFSGDTLFNGGPGATGRSFSDRATLVESIERSLLGLPKKTLVFTGHGDATTIGDEIANVRAS